MGNCTSQREEENIEEPSQTVSKETRETFSKKQTLQYLTEQLQTLEDHIELLRKEDVHFRMANLIFTLNALNEINPFIKKIEEFDEETDFITVKKDLENIFYSIKRIDRLLYHDSLRNLKAFFEHSGKLKTNEKQLGEKPPDDSDKKTPGN